MPREPAEQQRSPRPRRGPRVGKRGLAGLDRRQQQRPGASARDEFAEHIHEVLAGLDIRFRRLGHRRDDNRRTSDGDRVQRDNTIAVELPECYFLLQIGNTPALLNSWTSRYGSNRLTSQRRRALPAKSSSGASRKPRCFAPWIMFSM
jgi:hypothetical protein